MLGSFCRWLAFCGLLLAAACDAPPLPPPTSGGPALWRVQGSGIDGWLFGTIHVLPSHVGWQTEKIGQAINASDRLVLETAEIQDQARTTALFEKMGRSSGLAPLEKRVPAEDRAQLEKIASEGGTSTQLLSGYESWAAAMLLSAAAQQALDLGAGVEPKLIESFQDAGKPIGGLETVARQFGAFDTLPETAQQRLLIQTVRETTGLRPIYDRILKAWLKGDLTAIAREDQAGDQPDPTVEQAVLIERNRDWARAVRKLNGRPFIAVGTGHLTGRDNFIALLEAQGYKITRVQ